MRLLATSIGRPRVIGTIHGEPVLSGIFKQRVDAQTIFVRATNIDGDEQADLTVHGGPDKAVYLYPSEHWPWWEREHGLACAPASFGENLTLEGADETQIHIGDRLRWGDVLLEVSQPRGPCYKLGIFARPDAPQLMTMSARCGWYCRVLEEGTAPTHGALEHISVNGPSVRDAFVAVYHPRIEKHVIEAVFAAVPLAESWRAAAGKRLQRDGDSKTTPVAIMSLSPMNFNQWLSSKKILRTVSLLHRLALGRTDHQPAGTAPPLARWLTFFRGTGHPLPVPRA